MRLKTGYDLQKFSFHFLRETYGRVGSLSVFLRWARPGVGNFTKNGKICWQRVIRSLAYATIYLDVFSPLVGVSRKRACGWSIKKQA